MNHLSQSSDQTTMSNGGVALPPDTGQDNSGGNISNINIRVETMTLNELAAFCRRVGISTSEVTLADGIEQGVFPYGDCIKNLKTGTRQFVIYKQMVYDYYDQRAMRNS
jgi:hypothetical protein